MQAGKISSLMLVLVITVVATVVRALMYNAMHTPVPGAALRVMAFTDEIIRAYDQAAPAKKTP